MRHRLSNARRNAIPYLALLLVLAIGLGGGYAFAASHNKKITVCADKRTGILHLKMHGRCKRTQRRVTWNQQGPPGPRGAQGAPGTAGAQGLQGPTGVQGPAGVSVWANVAGNGVMVAGQGLSVQRLSAGTYEVTVTDSTCDHANNAPVVSVSDANPPNEHSPGSFPMAWYGATGANQQFTVFTGDVVNNAFSASDHTFDILDTCQ